MGWNSTSWAHFPSIENNLSDTEMSNLLIIYVTVLCLQAKADIVSNKEKIGF